MTASAERGEAAAARRGTRADAGARRETRLVRVEAAFADAAFVMLCVLVLHVAPQL